MPRLTFWFDFASTYSYLTAMRIGDEAARREVAVAWQPFLLGPIFKAQGWATSPFNLYPAKGRYMWRDMEREAARLGLPPVMRPEPFPQSSLLAARVALAGIEEGWGAEFCRAVFAAEFGEGLSIADPGVLSAAVEAAGGDAGRALGRAASPEVKARLREVTARAEALGIFGAPSFTCADGELFWGNDRLEAALDRAAATKERDR
ncbi:MAG TPA: 2-hydroxychromene-2-carboxylate isomerase [Thermohalobaculum sp.]|nr:2-hydroxychromene-2-carboxylate isomerase [Thermohalobaculum sp.]